jgi:non-ribosomal peptide synthetase component F
MLGLFINMLPFRVRLQEEEPLLAWLQRLQADHAELRQFEHTPLDRVQRWSDVALGKPLFESTLAFENYPLDGSTPEGAAGLLIGELRHLVGTNYPLVLMIVPHHHLSIRVRYWRSRFDDAFIGRLLSHFELVLDAICAQPDARVAAIAGVLDAAARTEAESDRRERERLRIERLKQVHARPFRLSDGGGLADG